MTQGDWRDPDLRAFGLWFAKRDDSQGRLALLLNGGDSVQSFTLPTPRAGAVWKRLLDTAHATQRVESLADARHYPLIASSVALLEC